MSEESEIIVKKKHHIYLCGNISENPRTYEWREEFAELTKDLPVIVLDPCKNEFNQRLRRFKKADSLIKSANALSQHVLRAKDYQLIKISSILVVNLGAISDEKPPLGTVMELCWAHDIFYIPIIAILDGQTNLYTRHPWIDECCSAKIDTVKDGVEIIKFFFLDF